MNLSAPRIDARLSVRDGCDCLCLAFSSYGADGAPPKNDEMEWSHLLAGVRCHSLLMIDVFQHWYHGPILNFSSGLGTTVAELRRIADDLKPRRLITLGSSMGGHGALLFGALLKADVAIAFSPQVNLEPRWLASIGDGRWTRKIEEMAMVGYDQIDLRETFAATRPTQSLIYIDPAEHLDRAQADLLRPFPGVDVRDRHGGGHAIAYDMAKSGEVTRLLEDCIAISAT